MSDSTIPATHKALSIPEFGSGYQLTTRSVHRPGPGNVLVKIEAIGLNPVEWRLLKVDFRRIAPIWGGSESSGYPLLTGLDGAGTVVEVGPEVKGITIGDRVTFEGWWEPDLSTYQEYTIAPAELISKIPSSMSFVEAASIPLGLVTAAFGLCLPYQPPPKSSGLGLKAIWEDGAEGYYKGQPILVFGGSSSSVVDRVMAAAIQIARYLGFSPLITTSSVKHTDFLLDLGATHIIDRNADVKAETTRILNGSGLKYVYDAVHSPITQAEVDFLAPGKEATAVFAATHVFKDAGRELFAKLPEFLEKGIIKPNRIEKLPGGLSGIVEGLARLETGQISGKKLIVVPSETPNVV
ncbi:hypothetical protein HGRIS_004455 [Hohenbuehelia grisea]|uniref:Enoyl reductase (ER) domain-containing protein n=1 Tax=Hohenbuehelia grisea TaxID=104357 RepID=A0ABR3JDL8_9AGAR